AAAAGVVLPEHHETARLAKRQLAEEDGVDDGEHRRVRADAECHGKDRHDGEGAAASERSGGVAKVLEQRVHGGLRLACAEISARRAQTAMAMTDPVFRAHRVGRVAPRYCAAGFECTANTAPCGSVRIATRSPPGTSIGGSITVAPAAVARS